MARNYSDDEKQLHLDQYKVSGKSKAEYARDNDIPETTFRTWVKEINYSDFGVLETEENNKDVVKVIRPVIFTNENIRIELRDGYDKDLLKKIIEVLVNDK